MANSDVSDTAGRDLPPGTEQLLRDIASKVDRVLAILDPNTRHPGNPKSPR